MDQILAFVFGIVIGGLLIALVYSVIGIVKLNKNYKQLDAEFEGLHHYAETIADNLSKKIENLDARATREVDEIYQNFERVIRQAESHTDKTYDNLAKKIADAFKVDDFVFDVEETPKKVKKIKTEQINS